MMNGSQENRFVEDTNLESLQSKLSLIDKGFRNDPFLRRICPSKTRSPSINAGYYIRNLALEVSFERLIMDLSCRGIQFQVLSCGAGYDTAYFRLKTAGFLDSAYFVEIDFPRVAYSKSQLIQNHPVWASTFADGPIMRRYSDGTFIIGIQTYSFVACDLTDIYSLENKLEQVGFDFNKETIILSECSLTYVDTATDFFQWLASRMNGNATLVNYEQICPDDRFGRIMVQHFNSRGSPLMNVHRYKTIDDHYNRFLESGWTNVRVCDLSSILQDRLLDTDKGLLTNSSDFFDEYEELFLKCGHYVLVVAGKSSNPALPINNSLLGMKRLSCPVMKSLSVSALTMENPSILCRYGHSSVLLSNKNILIIGGFSNSRDGILAIVDPNTSFSPVGSYSNDLPKDSAIFNDADVDDDNVVWIFGGRSSPLNPTNRVIRISEGTTFEIINTLGDEPKARWKHTFTYVGNDSFCLIGGKNQTTTLSDIVAFDSKRFTWMFRKKRQLKLHSHSTSYWKNGMLVITGGLTDINSINEQVYLYNFDLDEEPKIVAIKGHRLLPRFSHSSHIVDDKLYLIGGVSYRTEPGIAVINLKTGMCLEYEFPKDPLYLIYNHSSYIDDSNVVIIGGGGNCFSFNKKITDSPILLELPD